MTLVRIKLDKIYNKRKKALETELNNVQGIVLCKHCHDGTLLIMFTNVSFVEETETYGRKGKKTRQVEYVELKAHGWNYDMEFLGCFGNEKFIEGILLHDLGVLRKNFTDFKKSYNAMVALEEEVNKKK